MNKLKGMNRTTRTNYLTYILVIAAYVILEVMLKGGGLKAATKGMLVPICAYIVMALSLNLTVGVMGELSLGHAGFMSVGAFTGTATTMCLVDAVPNTAVRLCIGIIVGAIAAAIATTWPSLHWPSARSSSRWWATCIWALTTAS